MEKEHSHGFTLIEVMMTMAIAAIVLTIGVPSYQNSIQNTRKITAINDLTTALNLARSTAVTRRVRVTVCKSSDGLTCATGGGSGDWSQGWMVFTNPNGIDGAAGLDAEAGEVLLRVHETLPGNATFAGVALSPVVNRVSFKPQGMVDGNLGTITYCDSRGYTHASALVISFGGQIRHAIDEGGDGIVDIRGTNRTNVRCPT